MRQLGFDRREVLRHRVDSIILEGYGVSVVLCFIGFGPPLNNIVAGSLGDPKVSSS